MVHKAVRGHKEHLLFPSVIWKVRKYLAATFWLKVGDHLFEQQRCDIGTSFAEKNLKRKPLYCHKKLTTKIVWDTYAYIYNNVKFGPR